MRFFVSILLLFFAVNPTQGIAVEKETIRWLGWMQKPNFIPAGEYSGQGIGDSFTKTLQLALPQFNHRNIISNSQRYNKLIQEEDVCVAWAWIVPGSRSFRLHSRAVSLAPPSGIQTLKSKQHLFGNPGEVLSLKKLLENPTITLGYLEGMHYSKRANDLIKQYRGKKNVYFSSRSEVEFSLSMLDRNRLDYFIGFASQAIFDAEINGIPNKYQFYNIEEIDTYTSMHTHCSNTPFGQKVMEQVNRVITNKMLMDHLEIVERWNGKNKMYRDTFMDYVIHQQPNSLVKHPGQ